MSNLPNYELQSELDSFSEPTAAEITTIIKGLKNGKASGRDGFLAITLKKNLEFFVPIMQQLVSLIFNTGRYPDALKKSSTDLIYKKGDPEDLGPIAR